jgi:hypothetical protein
LHRSSIFDKFVINPLNLNYMPDATIAFSLIPFADIKNASFSSAIIPRSSLRNCILFAKTGSGNYAKMKMQAGPDLHISDLTVYNPAGCIIKTATNLVIHSSFSCDIDNALQTNAGADFWWHGITGTNSQLEPKPGATFALYPDFESIPFSAISAANYKNQKVAREWLSNQVIYCKTSQGRFAKLQVEASNNLLVRRMVVFNSNGSLHLDRSNITVPQTWTLDVDTGNVGAAGYDLWWEAVNASVFFLVPTNGAGISFDSYFRYEKYLTLIKNSAIRNALVISGATDRNYDSWTEIEKLQLREFIYLLETGKELPISGPPALTADQFMSNCDAIKIYMAHVAQSLWVDANNGVSWKLAVATANHLTHLFDMRKMYAFSPGNGFSFSGSVMGNVTHWSPGISYKFLKDNSFIKANIWETIKALTNWCRANLNHIIGFAGDSNGGPFATQQDQWQFIYGYRGLPLVDKMITPLPGKKHITHGCWGTDGFLAAVLRTVNIPVKHGRSNFSGSNHSRAEFFTINKNLAHGDDPYNGWVRLGINNVPIERVFMSNSEIATLIDAPAPLPGKSVAETASYHHSKHSVALAIEFKTNYLLRYRCTDINTGATLLTSKVWENLHEFYTDAEITTTIAACDAAIAAIPGGCGAINAV